LSNFGIEVLVTFDTTNGTTFAMGYKSRFAELQSLPHTSPLTQFIHRAHHYNSGDPYLYTISNIVRRSSQLNHLRHITELSDQAEIMPEEKWFGDSLSRKPDPKEKAGKEAAENNEKGANESAQVESSKSVQKGATHATNVSDRTKLTKDEL
jgi:hypothetical protein